VTVPYHDSTLRDEPAMTCASCQSDASESDRGGDFFPRCPKCGRLLLTAEAEAGLEGFRARLAQFGLGGGQLTRSPGGTVEEG
jgi:predicted RNA-binding Zn-ribbon protein involved in translation (DUF1610 family)